ncbi:MAG: glycosyltransferase family 2 protein [Phycisphaeraceae bacterium]
MVICCANVADTLEAACRSVAWADELIIVDSGSTDATPEIARRYATRYLVEPWRGYTGQKKWATDLASHDWVLLLDGDEEVSPKLAEEIQAIPAEKLAKYDVLDMPRRNHVMGRAVRAWWPDAQTRFYHKERVRWGDHVLHDARYPGSPDRLGHLRGWLEHKRTSAGQYRDYFDGQLEDRRALPVARYMYARGKRAHWWDLVFRPPMAFLKFYLVKKSFLDGGFGLLIAWKALVGSVIKYSALWAIQHGVEPAEEPGEADQPQTNTDRHG